MSGALLRSGAMRDYFALGAVGHPVYQSASQLRVAIRSQLGADVADIFALPKKNDSGEFVDWYAPMAGPVVPWTSATEEERATALELLRGMRERVLNASEKLSQETDSERQVFGRLLQHVMSFPDDQHVYLVDGKPVLSFWGFRNHDGSTLTDPLSILGTAPAAAPVSIDVAAEPEPVVEEEVVEEPRRRWPWWLWLFLLLLVLLPLLFLLRSCLQEPVPGPLPDKVADPAIPLTDEAIDDPTVVERRPVEKITERVTGPTQQSGVTTNESLIDQESTLDQSTDNVVSDPLETEVPDPDTLPSELPEPESLEPEEPAPDTLPPELPEPDPLEAEEPAPDQIPPELPEPDPLEPEQPEAEQLPPELPEPDTLPPELPEQDQPPQDPETPLTIPSEALEQGNLDFLNGKWSSNSGLIDETGRPVRLDYDFKDGEGEVSLRRSDGTMCRGEAKAEVGQQGLTISDQSDIRCPDGHVYERSTVDCTLGDDGQAECNGRYDTGNAFPVEIRKAE